MIGRFGGRTVFVVDDPDISRLRSAGVYYEYAPATEEVPADVRLGWIVEAYGLDGVIRLEPDDAP